MFRDAHYETTSYMQHCQEARALLASLASEEARIFLTDVPVHLQTDAQ